MPDTGDVIMNDLIDVRVLSISSELCVCAKHDDIERAKTLLEELRTLEPQMREYNFETISDNLMMNTYEYVTDTHMYILDNLGDKYPDKQRLIRCIKAKYTFNRSEEERRAFVKEYTIAEQMFAGFQADYYFCSMLIRMCLMDEDFDMISNIQNLLSVRAIELSTEG